MWEKGKVNASPTTHLRPTIMKYNLVSKQIDAQYLPYACHGHLMGISWTSHRPLMDFSWISLCEPSLQGHEFAMITTCDHGVF